MTIDLSKLKAGLTGSAELLVGVEHTGAEHRQRPRPGAGHSR